MNERIEIVYHIAIIGTWFEIVSEQLSLLDTTGLGEASTHIHVSIVGKFDRRLMILFKQQPFFSKCIFKTYENLSLYEFPSILKVQEIAASNPIVKILYFHTKGASYSIKDLKNGQFNQIPKYKQWRKFMEHYTIKKWKICISFLEENDCCGTDWVSYDDKFHFSGNFWWANGLYINKCQLNKQNRYDAEYFIGTGKPKVKEIMSSINNREIKKYLSEEEINKMAYFIGGNPLMPIFNWVDYYYRDIWLV